MIRNTNLLVDLPRLSNTFTITCRRYTANVITIIIFIILTISTLLAPPPLSIRRSDYPPAIIGRLLGIII